MKSTGTGIGGNGGVEAGSVEQKVFERNTYMLPFEKVKGCAESLTK